MRSGFENNVICAAAAIKRGGAAYPQNMAGRDVPAVNRRSRALLFEQFFGGGAVGFDPRNMCFDSGDLGFQRFDAGVKFLDRERVEVLLGKLGQRIAGLGWKKIVQIHGPGR